MDDLRAGQRRGAAGQELRQALRDEFQHHVDHKRCIVDPY
jgi:hypothetical protein